jgi:SulP family sulfate permease
MQPEVDLTTGLFKSTSNSSFKGSERTPLLVTTSPNRPTQLQIETVPEEYEDETRHYQNELKSTRSRRKYTFDQCEFEVGADVEKKESDRELYFQQFVACIFAAVINILDGCTFGLILLPPNFSVTYNTLGVSIFLYATVVVQAVFTRRSGFTIGLGTAMAENIPFLHSMASGIKTYMENEGPVDEVSLVATVMVCYGISTLIVGVCFYAVGYYKAGQLLHYFPHHIIVGVIGGFGFFLLTTALEISTAIPFAWDVDTLESYLDRSVLFHWLLVFGLGVVLRLMQWKWPSSQFIAPAFMLAVPVLFYLGLFLSGTSIDEAQTSDWLFQKTAAVQGCTEFWLVLFEGFKQSKGIHWAAIMAQGLQMMSLTGFVLLMVPLRVPSLTLTTGQEADFDNEMKAHGIANMLAGATGGVHVYLSYVNSVFYYKANNKMIANFR